MGKQRDTEIIGTIDNVICYKSYNQYLMRAKGNTGKQGEAAKIQASVLGRASSLSARVRKALAPILNEPGNRKLMYRVNNAFQKWLKTNPTGNAEPIVSLQEFLFHTSDEDKKFGIAMPAILTSQGPVVYLPTFDSPNPIYPLPFKGVINLHFVAVTCNLNDVKDTLVYESDMHIDYDGTPIPGRELLLPLAIKPGNVTLVALSINKHTAGVVGAWG